MNKIELARTSLLGAMLAASLNLSGCAGYRAGSMLPDDLKTVHVETVVNKSSEPLIESDITQALISGIQLDGSLKVVPADQADAILRVTLKDYELEPLAYRKDVRAAADQYRINLTASMELRRRPTHVIVAESARVTGQAVFDVSGDLSSSKLSKNPVAAEDLAKNIVQQMVEFW